MILWNGACPTHIGLSADDIRQARRDHPEARVMAHPECRPEVLALTDRVAGTGGMVTYAAKERPGTAFIVGTEIGLIHRLEKENPDKAFYPATDYLVCPTMKLTTLEGVARSLERMEHVITVEESICMRAQAALDAMLAVG